MKNFLEIMLPISRLTEKDAMQFKQTCWDCWYANHGRWGERKNHLWMGVGGDFLHRRLVVKNEADGERREKPGVAARRMGTSPGTNMVGGKRPLCVNLHRSNARYSLH